MSYPLRENLEIFTNAETWIRCTRCLHLLCTADKDWRKACKIKLLPPIKAGPLMNDLTGYFLLEQLYCPSCGVLLDTSVVEAR